MLNWTPEAVRFRLDAARVNGFEQKLADRLARYLPVGAHICDAGCGLGDLSLALAERGYRVTAVDTDERALTELRRRAHDGIDVVCADVLTMQPKMPYDAMVFCFFCGTAETVAAVRRQCSGQAFLIKRDSASHRFGKSAQKPHRFTLEQTCCELNAMNMDYRVERFTAEMGQPLRSLREATEFFALYHWDMLPKEVEAQLVPCDSAEFPFYYPVEAPLGLIILEGEATS